MIDVVIVNWNAGQHLKTCVESLLAFGGTALAKVIVVDNGSTDDSLSFIPIHSQIECIRLSENVGFASGCNRGAERANAEFVLFLNPDAAIYSDTFAKVLQFMQSPAQQNIGICGVKLLDEHGHVARSCSRFPSVWRCLAQSLGVDKVFKTTGCAMQEWDHLDSRLVDQVIGAFFFVRTELFQQLKGFDERFFVYYEEVDFAYRAKQLGMDSFYLSDTTAYHLGGGVSNQVKAKRLFYTLRSRILYSRKHFSFTGFVFVTASVLCLEFLIRLLIGLLQRSSGTIREVVHGYQMLFKWLPDWIVNGTTR